MTTTPNFFVVGAARSGTTSLTEMLRRHPQAFVTTPKEPHFLAFEREPVSFTGPRDDVTLNRVAVTDVREYLDLYRGSDRFMARGEGSVSTLYYADRAIESMFRHFPDAKVIALLRDPVERAFSSFQFLRSRGFETCTDFEAALDLEASRISAGWHHLWHYAAMGRYGRHLQVFVAALGRERVKIVFFDDFAREPLKVFAEICDFLGIEPQSRVPGMQLNSSGNPRNEIVYRAFARLERSGSARRVIAAIVPRRTRDWVRTRNLRQATSPESARQRLHAEYSDDMAALRSLLTDEPAWLAGENGAL